MNEKFITFPQDHQLPSKDDLRGKVYYKYHNAWNHSTKSCWSFRSVIQDRVNKEVIVNFLGEKELIVKFLGEKEVIMKFLGEKEVAKKFPMEKKVMVKPLGEKKAMVIDEDPFPPAASIYIATIDSRAMPNAKKAGRFSPSAKVRKVSIPKQYLTYKNDLAEKGRVPAAREWKKNGRYPYHSFEESKLEAKKNKFSKKNNVSLKERHVSQREKGMNDPSRRKIPQRFVVPPTISPV